MFEENKSLKEKLILTSLMDDGIITDIEYRMYASGDNFAERRAAILDIILSKYEQEPNSVLEMCKRLTSTNENQEKVLNIYPSDGEDNSNPLNVGGNVKNPLLNATILQCMFDFASLKDLKKFRLVCRQWNSIIEPLLRKKSRILFTVGSLTPKKLIESMQHSLPDLPVTSFRFSSCSYEEIKWDLSDMRWFFENWGKNIKELHLDKLIVDFVREVNISSWLKSAINLSKLTISTNANFRNRYADTGQYSQENRIEINLESLASINSVSLTNCTVVLPCTHKDDSRHIVHSEITLDGVRFIEEIKKGRLTSKQIMTNVRLNDFMDFGRATQISVTNRADTIFDMTCQVFNSQRIRLDAITVLNLQHAKGKLDSFHTSEDYVKANQLEIKDLKVTKCRVDLCVLPCTIEKLHLEDCSEIICNSVIQFPKLQFASFQLRKDNCEIVSRFAAFQNLVELEIASDCSSGNINYDFDVQLIPRSVKRMKIKLINLVGRSITFNLDILIVQIAHYESFFTSAARRILKMDLKVKVLVVSCIPSNGDAPALLFGRPLRPQKKFWDDAFNANDAAEIIRLNKTFKKIVIGADIIFDEKEECDDVCVEKQQSGSSVESDEEIRNFSSLVDEKANYYIFQNQRGKALLQEEFEKWTIMNDLTKL